MPTEWINDSDRYAELRAQIARRKFEPMTTAEHDQIMHGPECNDPTLHEHDPYDAALHLAWIKADPWDVHGSTCREPYCAHTPEDYDTERYEHTCPGSE